MRTRSEDERLRKGPSYNAGMLATFSEWMLGLPAVLQLLVAVATLMAIGMTPLVLWLGFQVISTGDRPAE